MTLIVKAQAVVPKEKKVRAANQYATAREEYNWGTLEGGYYVLFPKGDFAKLVPVDGEWQFELGFNGVEIVGRRKTLELAFKAADSNIYNNNKDYWLKTRSRVVLEKFEGIDSLFEDSVSRD